MSVTTEAATVYRGGGRRWFTKKSAIYAEAKACYRMVSHAKDRCGCGSTFDDTYGVVPYSCDYHDYQNSKVRGRYIRYATHCIAKAST